MSVSSRFWPKVNKRGPYPHEKACKMYPEIAGTRCWVWTAQCARGYGRFGMRLAHRISYELKHGKGSLGSKSCCHKCDYGKCVRPSHLFKASHAQNMRDMINKRRDNKARGSGVGTSKLDEKQVARIKKLYATGIYSQTALGEYFEVSQRLISFIVRNEYWRHVR